MIYDMLDFVAFVLCYLILQSPRWYIKRRCMQHLTKLHQYWRIHDDIWHAWFCLILLVVTCFYMCRITHGIEVFVDVFDVSWFCLLSFAGDISSCILKCLWNSWNCSCEITDGISSAGACHVSHNVKISSRIVHTCHRVLDWTMQDTIEDFDWKS